MPNKPQDSYLLSHLEGANCRDCAAAAARIRELVRIKHQHEREITRLLAMNKAVQDCNSRLQNPQEGC